MPEQYVGIADAAGDRLAVDTDGRITSSTVAQIATTMYTEATTARTTSSQTATQTWLANASTCWVTVNLTALSGGTSPTVTVSLQQLDGNGIWHTLASTSALNAVGTAQFSVGAGMTNGAMLLAGGSYRFSWAVTGTPATCSFQIALSGR